MKKKFAIFLVIYGIGLALPGFAQPVEMEWASGMGSNSNSWEYGSAVTTNAAGESYTAGRFWNTVDFDPGTAVVNLDAVGGANGFVLHLDTSGGLRWVAGFKGHGNAEEGVSSQVNDLTIDKNNHIYITGEFSGKVDFDPGPDTFLLTSTYDPIANKYKMDAFVLSLDFSGSLLWVRKMGGPLPDRGQEIALDNQGNLYVSGTFLEQALFDSATNSSLTAYGNSDIFLSKLDTSGSFIWTEQIGGPNADFAYGLAVDDRDGSLYLSGGFSGTCDFNNGLGTDTLTSTYGGEIFTAKYDSSGSFTWVRNIVGDAARSVLSHDVLVDKVGNVYTAGRFNGTADFNPEGSGYSLSAGSMVLLGQSVPGQDGFIQKRDPDGNFIWAGNIGGAGSLENEIRAMALGAAGTDIYLTGVFQGTADLDPGQDTFTVPSFTGSFMGMPFHTPDAFIAKIDTGGTLIWAEGIGGPASELSRSIALDGFGQIYLTGDFNGAGGDADFAIRPDTFQLSSAGANDIFIAKYFECIHLDDLGGITGPDSICLNTPYTYSVDVPEARTYSWTLPEGWTGSDNRATLEVTATGSSGIIQVTAFGMCDTISLSRTVHLRIPKANITIDNFTLGTASLRYDSWQWFLEGTRIEGATGPTYTVSENGEYSVVVTGEGCADTAYYTVTNVSSIARGKNLSDQIIIYPNPTAEIVHISSPIFVHARLLNIEGRRIRMVEHTQGFSIQDIAPGIYLLQIINAEDNRLIKVEKIVRQ